MIKAEQPALTLRNHTTQPKPRKSCKYCRRTASRAGGLCHRHHRMWQNGDTTIVPNLTRRAKPAQTCTECKETATAKGLCPKHYSRMRRLANRPRCTLPYCNKPKNAGDRLYCSSHSGCTADGCTERFKARRLCAKHYQTLYLAPRNRTFLTALRAAESHQPELIPSDAGAAQKNGPIPDHLPFAVTPGALPLHAQAGCEPSQAQDLQQCLEAINLLKRMGVLPPSTILRAQARTSRMLSNRLAKTGALQGAKP